jgi:hypothetical protein
MVSELWRYPIRLSTPQECEYPRGPLGQLREGRPTTAVAEQHAAPIVAPWIRSTGPLPSDRSGRCRQVYAGMRTFISVMPWIRFE